MKELKKEKTLSLDAEERQVKTRTPYTVKSILHDGEKISDANFNSLIDCANSILLLEFLSILIYYFFFLNS